jgi:hypothetical protein
MSFWIGFFVGGIFGVMIFAVLVANKDERQYDAPAADVVEVRHGAWLDTGDLELDTIYSGYKCSVCGFIICGHSGNYCSECGAKMDGERGEV